MRHWDEFDFLDGVLDFFCSVACLQVRWCVVTNQRGVALGRMSRQGLDHLHERMVGAIAAASGLRLQVYACPHHLRTCACRKPQPGMLNRFLQVHPGTDLSRSFMIGDSASDMLAGHRAGVRPVLVTSQLQHHPLAEVRVPSLAAAAPLLCRVIQKSIQVESQ